MRLVLDTNTAISGLLWHGIPGRLIDAAQAKSISLYTSAPLLGELRGVLARGKSAIARDPADDVVLATALAAQADLIVSGDADVLNLKTYQGIPIVTAAEASLRIAQR